MDKNKKYIAIGGGVLLASILGYFGYQKLIKKEDNQSKNVLDDTLNNLQNKTRNINDADAADIANRLYLAMKDMGTDEEEIEKLLVKKTLTSADVIAIVKSFGTKKYGTYGSPAFEWLGGDDLDLRGWLRKEVSDDLMDKINIRLTQAGFVE